MNSKVWLFVGLLIATVFWMIPFEEFSDMMSFEDFNVDVETSFIEGMQNIIIPFKIMSWDDATNIDMRIKSYDELNLVSNNCLNSTISFEKYSDNAIVKIPKMESGSNCRLEFTIPPDDEISRIIVTADGLKKYEWTRFSETQIFSRIAFMLVGIVMISLLGGSYYLMSRKDNVNLSRLEQLPTGDKLREKYGESLDEDDEKIIKAINKGKHSVETISLYTTISKRKVRKRLKLMEKHDMFYLD